MNIAEATKEALEKGLGITRASWRFNNEVICLIPTNTTLCCVMGRWQNERGVQSANEC